MSTKGAKWDAAPTGTSTRRGEKMGKSRGGGRRLARVLAQLATSRDGWVEAQSGRARAGGEAEVVSGLRPGADSQGRGFCQTPASRPSNSRGAAWLGGVGLVPKGALRVPGAGGGTRVGTSVGGGVWEEGCLVSRGDAEGWESSAEELPLRPWAAGDGRGGTSNRLSASRGRRFETSRRSLSGGPEHLGPRQPHRCEPLGTLALGVSQPGGPSARSLLSLSCAWRPLLHAASPGCEFSFSHSQFPVPHLPLECRTF